MRLRSTIFLLVFPVLPLAALLGFSQLPESEPIGPELIVERVERISGDEVHFTVKVTNRSSRAIYLTGINYELMGSKFKPGKRLDPVYFEQWRLNEGWTAISCMDTRPPHILKLDTGEAMTEISWAKLPMRGVCKKRITRWEGKFRFRLEYLESAKQAHAYLNKIFSPRWKEARAAAAVSEPFEIPPEPHP